MLILNLLNRFLWCKTSNQKFLASLEKSTAFIDENTKEYEDFGGGEEDDVYDVADKEEEITSDFELVISRIIKLIERVSVLPLSAGEALAGILSSSYVDFEREVKAVCFNEGVSSDHGVGFKPKN